MAITKFLYITLADSNGSGFSLETLGIPLTYNGTTRSIINSISGVYRITQEATSGMGAVPWQIESIPLNAVDIEVTYDSGTPVLSSVPKNVGRYDYTIRTTLKSDTTYKGYFATNYYATTPVDIPAWSSDVRTNAFITDVGGIELEKDKDPTKVLLIRPATLTITFGDAVRAYNKSVGGITYTTTPKILDPNSADFGKDVEVRLSYAGPKSLAQFASPVEIGTYTVSANSIDMNYSGQASTSFEIRALTASEAETAKQEYAKLVNSLPPDTMRWVTDQSSFSTDNDKAEFIASGILSVFGESEVISKLDTVNTVNNVITDCTKNLPQKLMTAVVVKLLSLAAAYVPGLAISNLINEARRIIDEVQRIMELIEFIKNNPYAFLNNVLTATGAYTALGNVASETINKIESSFPDASSAVGDVGKFIANVANGVVDICQTLDLYGNPMSARINADNTKVPASIVGFTPLVNRQPTTQKIAYEKFQYRLRTALYKDNEKIKQLNASGDVVGVRNYVSMLAAVHELAYGWHDKIASTSAPVGLLSASQATGLQDAENILDTAGGLLQGIYGTPNAINSSSQITTASASGVKQNAPFLTSQLNTGVTAATSGLGVISDALNATGNLLSGETKYSLRVFKNEFNFNVKKQLAKHPYWSNETTKEYNERVQRIQYEMENSTLAILNNPAFAKI